MPQNTTPEKLTAQQERVLERLLAGETVAAAAEAVGMKRKQPHATPATPCNAATRG
jgi:hypothetical protein